ncbi:hypothetical protein, partial [uncultured Bradyrhizobium sp.]|uniref:hypothetical protein n=1 Tax=uncultured Bradyrhizobium sp. TaxID=199684 RepID=UPI0035CA2FAD
MLGANKRDRRLALLTFCLTAIILITSLSTSRLPDWHMGERSAVDTFLIVGCATAALGGIFLAYLSRRTLVGLDLALFWLAITVPLSILVAQLVSIFTSSTAGDDLGVVIGSAILVATGLLFLVYARRSRRRSEIAVYWLGICIGMYQALIEMFEMTNSKLFGLDSALSGLSAWCLFVVWSAILVCFWRWYLEPPPNEWTPVVGSKSQEV